VALASSFCPSGTRWLALASSFCPSGTRWLAGWLLAAVLFFFDEFFVYGQSCDQFCEVFNFQM
jgi:hypothetical protein